MPFNSQSRIIEQLNKVFSPEGLQTINGPMGPGSSKLSQKELSGEYSFSLSQRASSNFDGGINQFEKDHLDDWPQDQQDYLRGLLIAAIEENLPTSFAWESGPKWRTILVCWGAAPQITFRSPYY